MSSEITTPPPTPSPQNAPRPVEPTAAELAVEFMLSPDIAPDIKVDPKIDAPKIEEPKKEEPKVEKKEVKFLATVKGEKKDETKPEIKQEVEPVKQEEKKSTQPIQSKPVDGKPNLILPPSAKGEVKGRDYSSFSEDEAKYLKGMSNESFEYASKLIRQNKELSKVKETQYLQHPNAYVLDPEFHKMQEDSQFIKFEADYWQKQLMLVAEGKDYIPLTGWDKDNNPIFGPAQKPSPTIQEHLRLGVVTLAQRSEQAQHRLQQFAQSYQGKVKGDIDYINGKRSEYFGWAADPSLMEHKIQIGDNETTIKDARNSYAQLYPSHYQNNPLMEVLKDQYVALQIYAKEIEELKSRTQQNEIKIQEERLVEPSSKSSQVKEKQIGGVTEFSLSGLPV